MNGWKEAKMADYKLISADSHVVEPRTMWSDYVDAEFRTGRRGTW